MFLKCILSKNIILTIMDFRLSDTNRGERSLLHNGYSYRIDAVLHSSDISWRCTNKKCKGRLRTDSGNGRTMVESRYHNSGLDSEIQS